MKKALNVKVTEVFRNKCKKEIEKEFEKAVTEAVFALYKSREPEGASENT